MFFYYIRLYVILGILYGMVLLIVRFVGVGWYLVILLVCIEIDRIEILYLK